MNVVGEPKRLPDHFHIDHWWEVIMDGCIMEGLSDEERRERYNQLYSDIRKNIDTMGFQVIGVFGDRDEHTPSFSYTIGLVERGWPEMIAFALPPQFAHAMFTESVKRWEENGVPESGDVDTEIANLPVCWKELPTEPAFADFLIQHDRYYESWKSKLCERPRRVMQLVWTDKDGRFPWQPGVDESCIELQSQVIPLRPN